MHRGSPAAAASIDAEHEYMLDTVRDLLGEPTAFDHSGWATPRCRTLEIVDPR
jgi:hypothetical protein